MVVFGRPMHVFCLSMLSVEVV